jgi:hypothetical protein
MGYQTTTLATLRLRLQERYESTPFWNNAEALHALNEALRKWNLYVGQWKTIATVPTTPNTVWYSMGASTIIYPLRAEWQSYPLATCDTESMDYFRPNWEAETTATSGAPSRPTMLIPAGLNLFALWPADSAGGSNMVLDGVRSTPVLAADTDFLDAGEEEVHAIVGEALCIAAFKESGRRFATAQLYHQQFLRAALSKNGRLKTSFLFRKFAGLDVARRARELEIPTQVGAQNG